MRNPEIVRSNRTPATIFTYNSPSFFCYSYGDGDLKREEFNITPLIVISKLNDI